MKKRYIMVFSVLCIGVLMLILAILIRTLPKRAPIQSGNDLNDSLKLYREFINGKATAKIDEEFLTINEFVNEYGSTIDEVTYAFFDMNGDNIPELHIRTTRFYSIFTNQQGTLEGWYESSVYSQPLNNRAILYTRSGGGPEHIDYQYTLLDFFGNEVYSIQFCWYSETEHKKEMYILDDVKLSKEDWTNLTNRYLSVESDLIEWITIETP